MDTILHTQKKTNASPLEITKKMFQIQQKPNNLANLSMNEHQLEQAQKVIQPVEAPLRTFL